MKKNDTVFIRTITNFYTGRIIAVDDKFVTLGNAAWIADTGRFTNALVSGQFSEVEPYPGEVNVAVAAIVDYCPFPHPLPCEQK